MAAPMMIPVNPAQKDDEFCRHKMQAIEIKIEGSGNGLKTVFPNIDAIATKLMRPAVLLTKYFGYELGAQAKFEEKDNKHYITGQFRQDVMQDMVYDFVKRFVMCPKCADPQTRFQVKRDALTMKCVACQHSANMAADQRNHRVNKLLVQAIKAGTSPEMVWQEGGAAANVGGGNAAAPAADSGARKLDPKLQAAQKDAESQMRTEEATAASAVAKDAWIKPDTAGMASNPILELARVLRSQQDAASAATAKAHQLKTVQNLDDDEVVRLCFQAAVASGEEDGSKPLSALASSVSFLRYFVPVARSQQDTANKTRFLSELVRTFKKSEAADRVPVGLALFLDEGICEYNEVKEWALNILFKDVTKEMAKGKSSYYQNVAKCCEPLFKWMGIEFALPTDVPVEKKDKKDKSDKKDKKSKTEASQ